MNKISVLMSVYNKENPIFFDIALKSIWDDQTVKPSEIILVQDGCVSRELKDVIINWQEKLGKALKLIKNKNNIGLTKSLNKGIMECKGDFIARMDSDDISIPNRFELQIDYFRKNPKIDVLGGSMNEFNEKTTSINIRTYPKSNDKVLKKISISSPICHPSVMFRRRVFDQGNRYDERYKTSQDIDFWFKLLKKGYSFSNLEEVIINFRIKNNFAQRRSLNKAVDEFKIYFNGTISLFGYSYKLIFPVFRLLTRLLPSCFINILYRSKARQILNS